MLSRLSFLQVIIFSFACLWLTPALSHEIRPAIIDINLDDNGHYTMAIKVNLEAMIAGIGPSVSNTNESESAQRYDELRVMPPDYLAQEFLLFEPTLIENINLRFDNQAQALAVKNIDIPPVGDLELARDSVLHFSGKVPPGSKTLSWQWHKRFGNAALRISSPDQPELFSTYLLDGKQSEAIPLANASRTDNSACDEVQKSKNPGGCINSASSTFMSKWNVFKNYLEVGFVHIIPKGLDHILFVVGLFLLSTSLRPLLIQVTTFTLAHSVTLALGIYGIINIPAAIVEPLIAASIVYVSIENIFLKHLSKWRPVVVFLFGLLHGLGFASVLTEIGLSPNNFVTGLVAFNLGVEFGQLTVIAICFLLVGIWFGKKPWYHERITVPASIVIALIATYWFFERIGML